MSGTLPIIRCDYCDNAIEDDWKYCPYCGPQGQILELETALLAETDLAKRQCVKIEELEAERDARPVVRWVKIALGYNLMCGPVMVGWIEPRSEGQWGVRCRDNVRPNGLFPSPEAAKAAVEQAAGIQKSPRPSVRYKNKLASTQANIMMMIHQSGEPILKSKLVLGNFE